MARAPINNNDFMAFQPKRNLEKYINFRDYCITKPEYMTGISLREGYGYRNNNHDCNLYFEIDLKIISYNIIGNLHTHEINTVLNRWGDMGVEGISIIKNDSTIKKHVEI